MNHQQLPPIAPFTQLPLSVCVNQRPNVFARVTVTLFTLRSLQPLLSIAACHTMLSRDHFNTVNPVNSMNSECTTICNICDGNASITSHFSTSDANYNYKECSCMNNFVCTDAAITSYCNCNFLDIYISCNTQFFATDSASDNCCKFDATDY